MRKSIRATDPLEPRDNARPLAERASAAARAEIRGDRAGILGAIGQSAPWLLARPRRAPERWSVVQKIDQHAAAVEVLRPAVAALEISRSKLAAWASIGLAGVVVFGWILEATVKWALTRALSHFP